jgi:phospholipid transport system substrate-binding protein
MNKTGVSAVKAVAISSSGFGAYVRAKVLLLALATVAFLSAAGSAQAESAATYMQRVANELIGAQRSGSASAFANVLRKHMDVPSIGLTALGPHAQTLPKTERPAYYNGMINFISKYAAKEAPKYPVATAMVVGQGEETKGGASVDSRITLRSGETYDIRWKLVRSGQSFKVRDAQVVGFWMTSFLDNLFQNYISDNGNNPRALVMALNH